MILQFIKYLFLLAAIVSCTSLPRFHSEEACVEYGKPDKPRYANSSVQSDSVLEVQTGIASYYADKFNGKVTYSGEIYNMYDVSAAHPTYPMGTIVRITNLENGKKVVLEINDRMPARDDRIIDLSLGAARVLGMEREGLAKVKIEVLKWGEGRK